MKLFNTLRRKKEKFYTIDTTPGRPKVSMYVCGVTPYDSPHIGHALTALRCSVLRQYLAYKGYDVTYVQNVTDIEDKIIARSRVLKESPLALARRYTEEYQKDMVRLGIPAPTAEPKVSEFLPQIISYIGRLLALGHAYVTPRGDVYFDISKSAEYGKLSGRKTEDMKQGTRESVREEKKHPLDFALWKRFSEDPDTFESPWGPGRPGWHTECCAMSNSILGPHIDIHCGGMDLLFPHHENEVAQCEAHNRQPFVNFWVHTGLMMVNGSKMSKSLGNFVTMDDGIKRYGVPLMVYVVMKFHYRSPINLCNDAFDESLNQLADLYWFVDAVDKTVPNDCVAASSSHIADKMRGEFVAAMDNDINSPVALVAFAQAIKASRPLLAEAGQNGAELKCIAAELRRLGKVLFLFQDGQSYESVVNDLLGYISWSTNGELPAPLSYSDLQIRLAARVDARQRGDFAQSDAIRNELVTQGVVVLDGDSRGWKFGVSRRSA
jgi:cysteinyl-tRNA synthetase